MYINFICLEKIILLKLFSFVKIKKILTARKNSELYLKLIFF